MKYVHREITPVLIAKIGSAFMISIFSGWNVSSVESLWAQKRPKPRWQDILKVLFKMGHQFQGKLYALIDTSRNDEVFRFLCDEKEEHRSLYQNTRFESLYCIAPILLKCHQRSKCLRWLSSDMWGEQMGTYFISSKSFSEVYQHLKNYSIVEDSNGVEMFFRLADPIVFHTLLCASSSIEQQKLMQPFPCVLTEYGSSGALFFNREHLLNFQSQNTHNDSHFNNRIIISDSLEKKFSDIVYSGFLRNILNSAVKLDIFCNVKNETERKSKVLEGVANAEKHGLFREDEILEHLSLLDKYRGSLGK